jgi:hypothetical protein
MMKGIASRIALAAMGLAAAGLAAATDAGVAPVVVAHLDDATSSLPWIAAAGILILLGAVALGIRRVPTFARH